MQFFSLETFAQFWWPTSGAQPAVLESPGEFLKIPDGQTTLQINCIRTIWQATAQPPTPPGVYFMENEQKSLQSQISSRPGGGAVDQTVSWGKR